MNTRKILVVSSDSELNSIIRISALTLTKLNCQVSIIETDIPETAMKESKIVNLDLIIIDLDDKKFNGLELIKEIRSDKDAKVKKIISVYSDKVDREETYKAGCDSIMSKDELKKVVNNILQF